MKPHKIARLAQPSEALRRALKADRAVIWPFLRHHVEARYAYYPCEQCNAVTTPIFFSPYSAPHFGWCLACLLQARSNPATLLWEEKEALQRRVNAYKAYDDEVAQGIVSYHEIMELEGPEMA